MNGLWQDSRYGARILLKNPIFAAISVMTLALGIGANTAIFSLLDALLLKPLPGVVAPEQMVWIGQTYDWGETYPKTNGKTGVRVVAGLGLTPDDRGEVGTFAGIQMGVVALVLLIACANIAGLLLTRTAGRQKEIGIRLALGAGRWRIVRQLLTESTMLALLGGAIGAVVALWLSDWMRSALPDQFNGRDMEFEFGPDARVLAFTLGLSLLTGILFGLAPALQVSKPDLMRVLKNTHRLFGRGHRARLRNALVVGQIALSLVLLISAELCVRTLRNARVIDVGFRYEDLLTAKVDLGRQSYSEEQGRTFYRELLERAASLPGVESASLALTVPLQGGSYGAGVTLDNQQDINIRYNIVTPSYLDMLGIPVLLGWRITEQDGEHATRVAIINETFARRAWPNETPVGKHFKWKGDKPEIPTEVIGVVRDTKSANLFQNTSYLAYLPLAQKYDGGMTLHLRTSSKPEQLVGSVQREISALDKPLPIYNFKTLEQYLGAALSPQRIQATLISAFGLLALALASVGLYGVLSYSVTQRTQEVGIRMALGAQRRDVLRLIIGQGLKLVALGLALGLACALAFTRVVRSLLYGVSPTDPLTFVVVPLVLTVVALLACYLPARRATELEPTCGCDMDMNEDRRIEDRGWRMEDQD